MSHRGTTVAGPASQPGAVIEPHAIQPSRWIVLCCAAVIGALYVVGVVSRTELRHFVQTLPLWLAVVLGAKRVRAVRWIALPMLVFWLLIVVLIWLYLLGWVQIASGTYSPIEIAMTAIIGAAAVGGATMCIRPRATTRPLTAVAAFASGPALQVLAFWTSFLPGIAGR